MSLALIILAFAGLAAFSAVAAYIARARYDAARDKAWAEFKPRPLRVHREIGEPVHGGGG